MEAICPNCSSVIDPTRAPVARVRGAKVLTFCSADCAAGKPVAAPPPEAKPAAPKAAAAKPPRAPKAATAKPPRAPKAATAKPPRVPKTPPPVAPPVPSVAVAKAPAPKTLRSPMQGGAPKAAASVAPAPAALEVPLVVAPDLPKRRRNRGVILGASVVLLAGITVVAADSWPGSESGEAAAQPHGEANGASLASTAVVVGSRAAPAAPAAITNDTVDADAPIDPKRLYDKAVAELNQLMGSRSRRVSRISAMALARTGDAKALARLNELLEDESSPLVEVQLGYALARAGNKRGYKVLVAGLRRKQRDVKLDAARSLVRLGDKTGAGQLRGMLSYRHYRLGAAGLLARLGDDKGFALLRAERKSKRSSREIRMRATVALGRAGDDSVADELTEIIKDGRYQVGAAEALAALKHQAAVPSLTAQLDIDAFRVQAALGLRRMGAEVDLAPLASALHGGSEVIRASASEAILILTGDASLSEHD